MDEGHGMTDRPGEAPIPSVADDSVSGMRKLQADNVIKNHVIMAMATGLIPSAMINVVGITALEVKMIGDLARVYDFPVPHRLVCYKIVISLIGSIGPVYLSVKMHSALKSMPLVGHAFYVGMLSLTGGAAVYAVGKLFQKHFESGGTFLSSENRILKSYFKAKYAEGKRVVPGLIKPAGA